MDQRTHEITALTDLLMVKIGTILKWFVKQNLNNLQKIKNDESNTVMNGLFRFEVNILILKIVYFLFLFFDAKMQSTSKWPTSHNEIETKIVAYAQAVTLNIFPSRAQLTQRCRFSSTLL